MGKVLLIGFGFALVLSFLQGCDKEKGAASSGASGPEVRLGYFANVTHAQAVLAVSDSSFQKAIAPAKLSTKVFNAGPSLIEALFAGEIDIGYVGPGPEGDKSVCREQLPLRYINHRPREASPRGPAAPR